MSTVSMCLLAIYTTEKKGERMKNMTFSYEFVIIHKKVKLKAPGHVSGSLSDL